MLKHEQIWSAIDLLAARHNLSASGLSRRAGLDPTTFNKSKRLTSDGRQRWPSTESIAKILMATGETLDKFVGLVNEAASQNARTLPLISAEDANAAASFDATGAPQGKNWDELALSAIVDARAFAMEIGASRVSPLYKDGDILIAISGSPVRRGDRAIIRLATGEMLVGEVKRTTSSATELEHCGTEGGSRACPQADIQWIARIHWVSQ